MTSSTTKELTLEHIQLVNEITARMVSIILKSVVKHDDSKLKTPEVEIFEEYTPKPKGSTYGSDEYNQFLKEMKPALDHHYKVNRHHPEYWENGIKGMTLMDLTEMIADWLAATKRHDDGNIEKSIEINQKRFGYSDDLKQIFLNTVNAIQG